MKTEEINEGESEVIGQNIVPAFCICQYKCSGESIKSGIVILGKGDTAFRVDSIPKYIVSPGTSSYAEVEAGHEAVVSTDSHVEIFRRVLSLCIYIRAGVDV